MYKLPKYIEMYMFLFKEMPMWFSKIFVYERPYTVKGSIE